MRGDGGADGAPRFGRRQLPVDTSFRLPSTKWGWPRWGPVAFSRDCGVRRSAYGVRSAACGVRRAAGGGRNAAGGVRRAAGGTRRGVSLNAEC